MLAGLGDKRLSLIIKALVSGGSIRLTSLAFIICKNDAYKHRKSSIPAISVAIRISCIYHSLLAFENAFKSTHTRTINDYEFVLIYHTINQ